MAMLQITPLTASFVADISGVTLGALTDVEFETIYQAWLDYGVLRFRNQPLNDAQLQSFSARFGPLEERPMGRMAEADKAQLSNRFVTVLSNIKVDGKSIGGLGNAEAAWHSDMTYVDNPPPASVLLGIEIPQHGGDTYFADQCAAFDALPNTLKSRVANLNIKHNAAHTSVGKLRPGYEAFDDPREAPGAVHPILRTHDETQRSCIYLGRREWAYVPGLSLAESEALLDELWSYAALEDNIWRQQWQPHDIVVWDNRRVLHRRDDFDANARRLMHRCQILQRGTRI